MKEEYERIYLTKNLCLVKYKLNPPQPHLQPNLDKMFGLQTKILCIESHAG